MTRPRSWRRLTTALALASVLVVGCWWMLDARGSRRVAAPHAPVAAVSVADESPSPTPLEPLVEEAARTAIEAPPAPVSGRASAAPPEPEAAPAPPTLRVLVEVVDPDGHPLAEIPVALQALHESRWKKDVETASTGPAGEAAHLEFSPELFEDGWNTDGAVRWFVGVSLHPESTPKVELLDRPQPGDTLRLVLEPGLARWLAPLRVRVIDELGEPVAGVPVALVMTKDGIPGSVDRRAGAVTRAPDGVAELPWGDRFESWELIRAIYPAMGMGVTLDLPLRTPPLVQFETEGDAPGLLDIGLPPMGWIELTVTGEGVDEVKGSWRRTDSDSPGNRSRTLAGVAGEPLRIGPLGLGWQVAIDLRDPRPGGSFAKLELRSPERKREVLSREVHLEGAPTPITFTASIVDGAGEPLGGRLTFMTLRRRDRPRMYLRDGQFTLDADGGIVWKTGLSADEVAALQAGTLGVDIQVMRSDGRGPAREVKVTLASDVPLSEAGALGALVLQPEEAEPAPAAMRSISGRIVDEFGVGIERAEVYLVAVPGESQRRARKRGKSEAEGRFSFEDVPDLAVEWTLSADCEMYLGASFTGTLNELGERILVLPSAGRVECRLLTDPETSLFELSFHLSGAGGSPGPSAGSFSNVRPGVSILTIGIRSSQWTLLTVPDINVEGGRVTSDPRLEELDLRGQLRKLRLKLMSAGQTVEVRHFSLKDPEGAGTRDPSTGPDGRCAILVPTRVEQFTLKAKGYLPVELTWRPDEQTVVLYPE